MNEQHGYTFSFPSCTASVHCVINRLHVSTCQIIIRPDKDTVSSAASTYIIWYTICYRVLITFLPLCFLPVSSCLTIRQMCILVEVTFKIYTIQASEYLSLCVIINTIKIYFTIDFIPSLSIVKIWLKHVFYTRLNILYNKLHTFFINC
jgi:hypothetical protein